jgi:hypothetical protein
MGPEDGLGKWTEHPIVGHHYRGGGFAGQAVHTFRCVERLPSGFYLLRTDYLVPPRKAGQLVDLDAIESAEPAPYERHLGPTSFAGPMKDYEHLGELLFSTSDFDYLARLAGIDSCAPIGDVLRARGIVR